MVTDAAGCSTPSRKQGSLQGFVMRREVDASANGGPQPLYFAAPNDMAKNLLYSSPLLALVYHSPSSPPKLSLAHEAFSSVLVQAAAEVPAGTWMSILRTQPLQCC